MRGKLIIILMGTTFYFSCRKDISDCKVDTSSKLEELVFHSGYEGFSVGSPTEAIEGISGIDTTFTDKNDWGNTFKEHSNFKDFAIYYEEGKASQRHAKIIEDPTDPNNKVLHFWLNEPNISYDVVKKKGRIQASLLNNENLTSIYIKQRLYLHPDLEQLKSYPEKINWLTLQEFWNNAAGKSYPFRVTLNIFKTIKDQGELYFGVHAQTRKKKQKWNNVWEETNESFTVPIGEWVTIETWIKEGDESDGRFKFVLTDEQGLSTTVFDITGSTYHPNDPCPNGFNRLNPMKIYTNDKLIDYMSENGKTLQMYWDDFEVWVNKDL